MTWNWQKKDWPQFKYKQAELESFEDEFLYKAGTFLGTLKHIHEEDLNQYRVDLLSQEAYKTSEIEGEILDRQSLQSSIAKNFGLKQETNKNTDDGIAIMMMELYKNFSKNLDHKTLYKWNSLILHDDTSSIKNYRKNTEPMQVVSASLEKPKIHFEAPPKEQLDNEMNQFIEWFNSSQTSSLKALTRAGIAHLYFVSIHPFEDGNGRIARALAEKILAQSLKEPSLISLSLIIEKKRKDYYRALDEANKDLEITDWLKYFAQTILEAQDHSQILIEFLVAKTKFYAKYKDSLNQRQEKVIARIFKEGLEGFKGGLSAENYISITQTSKATATRDLQDLVKRNAFYSTGQLKSTRYHLNLQKA